MQKRKRTSHKKRPQAVTRIALYVASIGMFFVLGGIWAILELLVNKIWGPGSERGVCLVIPAFIFGFGFLIPAWGFFQLNKRSYWIVRETLNLGWGSLAPGFRREIDSPEVRRAFGLSSHSEKVL